MLSEVPTVVYGQFLSEYVGQAVFSVQVADGAVWITIGNAWVDVEGGWYLIDPLGVQVDQATHISERTDFQLWKIVGTRFTAWSSLEEEPGGFILRFSSGHSLTILWDWEGLEAFTMEKIRGNPMVDDIVAKRGLL